jgi:hypothetical protein
MGMDMEKLATAQPVDARFLNTTVLTVNFITCMIYVVLVTLLVRSEALDWGLVEIGWLVGIPVLAGIISWLMLLIFDEQRRKKLSKPSPSGEVNHFKRKPRPTIAEGQTGSGRRVRYSRQGTRV